MNSYRRTLLMIFTLVSTPVAAQNAQTLCREFTQIQNYVRSISGATIHQVFPEHEWEENIYARRDIAMGATNVAKTLVFFLVRRANWVSYSLTPDRAEAATVTGSFIRSPDDFARFLMLPPSQACNILRFPGREADVLRDLAHEMWLMVRRAQTR